MAQSLPSSSWQRGFAEPTSCAAWEDEAYFSSDHSERAHYVVPDACEKQTSLVANEHGMCSLRSWPSLYNGTATDEATPSWWKQSSEVDVLIIGAGPFGLAVALNLARQGITFRVVDKAEGPCHSGRADSIQPRALEYLHSWGLGHEVTNEGPIVNKLILRRNGVTLAHNYTVQADSQFRGNHIISQGQIEKIYLRDLRRHRVLIERGKTITEVQISEDPAVTHPISARLTCNKLGEDDIIKAKYLIGADGAASRVREILDTPFDGLTTECFWTIMDCQYKTDYPHILDFSIVTNTELGGVIFVPREQGFTRVYVQVPSAKATKVSAAHRRNRKNKSAVGETQVHDHGITPDEALEQLNKVMAPWKFEFAGPMSWFAVWRVNERVARSFSKPDQRIHLGGDAAHVHSVLGAFGFNSSVYDAANLSWKLALVLHGAADPQKVLPTYDSERRIFANRVIRFSGAFLRFVCNLDLPLAVLRGLGHEPEPADDPLPALGSSIEDSRNWLRNFFGRLPKFMPGFGFPVVETVLSPAKNAEIAAGPSAVRLNNGVRVPDCRVALGAGDASYLYNAMLGVGKFHLLVFASDLQGPVRKTIAHFSRHGLGPMGFYDRFGGQERFNVVLILKSLPQEVEELLTAPDMQQLRKTARIVYDDRAPDEDAHYCYGVNHARGAVVVVRPDLIVGTSAWPNETSVVDDYLSTFLIEASPREQQLNSLAINSNSKTHYIYETNGIDDSMPAQGIKGAGDGKWLF